MHPFDNDKTSKIYTIMDAVFDRPSYSTVIDLTTDEPEILREGVVSEDNIKAAMS